MAQGWSQPRGRQTQSHARLGSRLRAQHGSTLTLPRVGVSVRSQQHTAAHDVSRETVTRKIEFTPSQLSDFAHASSATDTG